MNLVLLVVNFSCILIYQGSFGLRKFEILSDSTKRAHYDMYLRLRDFAVPFCKKLFKVVEQYLLHAEGRGVLRDIHPEGKKGSPWAYIAIWTGLLGNGCTSAIIFYATPIVVVVTIVVASPLSKEFVFAQGSEKFFAFQASPSSK
ncbi:hypothetical protein ACFE04_004017 [Oxalis oulophora]